jgi:Ca2+-binding RTX toxin-like protein
MRGTTTLAVAATLLGLTAAMPSAQAAEHHRHHVRGTDQADRLPGTSGDDLVTARAGNDRIRPAGGRDIVRAASGDDFIYLHDDGMVDRIHCGAGFDVVAYRFSVDQHDVLDDNCEGVIA